MPSPALQMSLLNGDDAAPDLRYEVRGSDHQWLRSRRPPTPHAGAPILSTVDLFAGCGGFSLGLAEAAHASGMAHRTKLAADISAPALSVFAENHAPLATRHDPIEQWVDGGLGEATPTSSEREWTNACGHVDILVGGPPCQGHSDLNNYARRTDARNWLFTRMGRATEVLRPRAVLIENVVGVRNDRGRSFQDVLTVLKRRGYAVAHRIVDATDAGVPQARRRVFLLATHSDCGLGDADLDEVLALPKADGGRRTVRWAISDLATGPAIIDQAARTKARNRTRIDWLFDNNEYDLPDHQRPACHRNGGHSYKSVYGRMRWDEPAQTVTRGFFNVSMGRHVHPAERRTLTAHEAARIQTFPDYYSFSQIQRRTTLADLIGNAVPPKLAYVLGLRLLEALGSNTVTP